MEGKEKIVTIAKSIILHYIKQNYSDKDNINQVLERVNEIFNKLKVSYIRVPGGSTMRGLNKGDGKISLIFEGEKDILESDEMEMISTLVHEIYHSISNEELGEKCLFLEEGFVTYLTAETIRYAIENPIEISSEITKENLKMLLEKQHLVNAYDDQSEFVRSMQLVMEQYGVDSKYEYIFNGKDRLQEVVSQANPKLGEILKLRIASEKKSSLSKVEQDFFKEEFKKIDYSNLSPTFIEMNRVLTDYLIESGEIDKNPNIQEAIYKFHGRNVDYEKFYLQAQNMSDEEIAKIVYEELPQESIDYKINNDIVQTIQQMSQIEEMYRKTGLPIQLESCGLINFYSILIAYDLQQKGIELPSQDDIMKYAKNLTHRKSNRMLILSMVQNYIQYVKDKIAEGKGLNQILNDYLANSVTMLVNTQRICESDLPDFEKIKEISNLVLSQSQKKQEFFYEFYFAEIYGIFQKQIDKNHIYNEEDYDKFMSQIQEAFNMAQVPDVMNEIGYSPEMLFFMSISSQIEMASDNFSEQVTNLLKIMINRRPNFGVASEELEDFAFYIKMAYEKLRESGNTELLGEFSRNLVTAFLKDNSELDQVTSEAINFFDCIDVDIPNIPNKIMRKHNTNIYQTIESILKTPEFYQNLDGIKDMFLKYPEIYFGISIYSGVYWKMVLEDLPTNIKMRYGYIISRNTSDVSAIMLNINYAIFGNMNPKIEMYTPEKLKDLSPFVQFAIKCDKYYRLMKRGQKEDAEKLFADDPILDHMTVTNMAKKPEVQMCNIEAQMAFEKIAPKSIETQDKGGKAKDD